MPIFTQKLFNAGGGPGPSGTTDYNLLQNKPKINNVELLANKTSTDLTIFDPVTLVGGKGIDISVLAPVGGIDENALLLMHFDGNKHNDCPRTDWSPDSTTQSGPSVFSSQVFKFGQSLASANNRSLTWTHPLMSLGNSNFTIDTWLNFTQGNFSKFSCCFMDNAKTMYASFDINFNVNRQDYSFYVDGTELFPAADLTGKIAFSQWNHFALVRIGSSFKLYLNGKAIDTATYAPALSANITNFVLGDDQGSAASTIYVDEFRLSNIARWSADFTPNSSPYTLNTPTGKYAVTATQLPAINQATTTTLGSVMLATDAEAASGVDKTKTITPSQLHVEIMNYQALGLHYDFITTFANNTITFAPVSGSVDFVNNQNAFIYSTFSAGFPLSIPDNASVVFTDGKGGRFTASYSGGPVTWRELTRVAIKAIGGFSFSLECRANIYSSVKNIYIKNMFFPQNQYKDIVSRITTSEMNSVVSGTGLRGLQLQGGETFVIEDNGTGKQGHSVQCVKTGSVLTFSDLTVYSPTSRPPKVMWSGVPASTTFTTTPSTCAIPVTNTYANIQNITDYITIANNIITCKSSGMVRLTREIRCNTDFTNKFATSVYFNGSAIPAIVSAQSKQFNGSLGNYVFSYLVPIATANTQLAFYCNLLTGTSNTVAYASSFVCVEYI